MTFQLPEYAIFLGDLAEKFPEWLQCRHYSRVLLLTDENTHRHCLPVFLEKSSLKSTQISIIPAGENHKTLATCEIIWQSCFDAQLDRKALVINLGGGVIGDMGGFCAATYKRGIDFVQVPTTLLAMTDASVGGKLGIDFQGIKNAVGVFQNPAAVFCDPVFFRTLPERELRSGFAEVIKHALIGQPALWKKIWSMSDLHQADWLWVLQKSLAVKIQVVKKDPLEKNLRQILNLGHTVGHAVESYFLNSSDPLTHGEAVAIGMICESYLAQSPNLDRIIAVVQRFFGHRHLPETSFDELWAMMQQDKKNAAGAVRMAVPSEGKFSMQILEPTQTSVEESLHFYNGLNKAI